MVGPVRARGQAHAPAEAAVKCVDCAEADRFGDLLIAQAGMDQIIARGIDASALQEAGEGLAGLLLQKAVQVYSAPAGRGG